MKGFRVFPIYKKWLLSLLGLLGLVLSGLACNAPIFEEGGTATPTGPLGPSAPRLQGSWRRTDALIRVTPIDPSLPTLEAPFKILGTRLRFDEESKIMVEETTSEYVLEGAEETWECNLAGAYQTPITINYYESNSEGAKGQVIWPAAADGQEGQEVLTPWQNQCNFQNGEASLPSMIFHVPLTSTPMLSFEYEISADGNTLLVAGAYLTANDPQVTVERIYVYEREE